MKKTKIPSAKKTSDKVEGLVKKHLADIAMAEATFKSASALLEKYKTKYPELEQYVKSVSPSERSIHIVDDVKDPKRSNYNFKIAISGVVAAYQITNPEEKEHTGVDQEVWISNLEKVLAEAIARIILGRQSEPSSG
jgi:hypothetical protein